MFAALLGLVLAALLAVLAVAEAGAKFVNEYWPFVAFLLPVVQALLVRAGAAGRFKMIVAIGFAAAAMGVSFLGYNWTELTPALVLERAGGILLVGQGAYLAADALIRQFVESRGLNELALFRPEKGVG